MVAQAGIVGRQAERSLIARLVARSADGEPSALLVCGEAGVGKTRLVTDVVEEYAGKGHLVLWGRCLRFGADSSPYLPIGQLLTQWHRQADAAERARVLAGATGLATIAPALGGADPDGAQPGRLVGLASTVVDRIAERAPTVLVVDDLHWADTTSLDLLAYLVTGFTPGQRLSLLATFRDTDLVEGHRLHGWLADLRRLPVVSQLLLGRLGLAETEALVAELCGAPGSVGRGADIHDRSRGNPYLVELLARASGDNGSAPAPRVDDLRQALLASWHRLDGPARELMQLLAAGGRPVAPVVLEQLAGVRGMGVTDVRSSLRAAAGEGITTRGAGGETWFHHPLLAEVIASTLSEDELTRVHRDYVHALEAASELPIASRTAHLALHHHGADHPDEAFTWSLRAADAALEVLAFAEECEHLHRACDLWPRVGTEVRAAAGDRADLLARASVSARRAGELLLAVELRRQAIGLVDPVERPAEAVRLRLPLDRLLEVSGLGGGLDLVANRSLLVVADRCPGTPERAIALAHLAFAELWNAVPDAAAHAEEAVTLARRLGSDEPLAWSLGVRSQTGWDTPQGLEDAEAAVRHALCTTDHELWGNAAVWRGNCLLLRGQISEAADSMLAIFERLLAEGSLHDAMFAQPGYSASLLLDLGRWDEVRALVRELLSRRLATDPAADIRGVASILAFRSGDPASGRAHMARVRELRPAGWTPGDLLMVAEVHEHWASGEPELALDRIDEFMPSVAAVDPDGADELLLWAARAAGDLGERPGQRSTAVARLDRIEELRGDATPWSIRDRRGEPTHVARNLMYTAERARCHADHAVLPALWAAVEEASSRAHLRWDQAVAGCRLAEALLATPGNRTRATTALRSAVRIARRLGALPIVTDAEALARQAHLTLDEPDVPRPHPDPQHWPSLTGREREVLGHLVAGHTYAEIAHALFISEKTVSVHVSNLLRKTGTSSRIEVAELARRTRPSPG